VLSRQSLKEEVEDVIQKGPDPQAGKSKIHDIKVMIQWYKRAGDGTMPKNKEGLLLPYRETCGRVMQGSYVPIKLSTATSTPMASASRYCVHSTTTTTLKPKNVAAAVLAPIPKKMNLQPPPLLQQILFPQLLFVPLRLNPHKILTGSTALILCALLMPHLCLTDGPVSPNGRHFC
jgi:hypothetical protein